MFNIHDSSAGILDILGYGVVVIDAQTHQIVYANAKILEMSGYSGEELIGRQCHKLLCPTESGRCPITDLRCAVDNSERVMIRKDGTGISILKTVTPAVIDGRKFLIESIVDNTAQAQMRQALTRANDNLKSEIGKRRDVEGQMRHIAYHDHLTGLPNRLMFSDQLTHAIALAGRSARSLAILYLDLDGFKVINDTMGHATGDQLLVEVAKRLSATIRKSDVIARIGGDEFVVLLENIDDTESVCTVADKLLESFDRSFQLNSQEYYITTSIGIALYPIDGDSAETLLKNADIAMYKAKEKGRRQWVLCSPVMKSGVLELMRLSNQLYRALDRNELVLYYQPQVNCNTGRIIGMEALIRWKHPELGLVAPARFIPIAEQTGLIHSIGDWVLRSACAQNKAWQDAGLPQVPVAVNLSVLQFQNPNIVSQVVGILEETGLEPKYLELEITESVAMRDARYVIQTLNAFKSRGISISIDDFGTEYSSLNYLKQLPIDKIKIAMPFIRGIEKSDKDEAITKAILVLAKSMGLRVIAEGVETETQLSFLAQHICDEVQGHYYYRPLPAAEAEKALRRNGCEPEE